MLRLLTPSGLEGVMASAVCLLRIFTDQASHILVHIHQRRTRVFPAWISFNDFLVMHPLIELARSKY